MKICRFLFVLVSICANFIVMADDQIAKASDEEPCTCVFNKNRMWNPEQIMWNNAPWKCTDYKDDGTCNEVQKVVILEDNHNGFLLAASADRLLTKAELTRYTVSDLRLIRNEIFARHGYIFKSENLRELFSKKSWYEPNTRKISLSLIERENVQLIKEIETKHQQEQLCKSLLLKVQSAESRTLSNFIDIQNLQAQSRDIVIKQLNRKSQNTTVSNQIIAEEDRLLKQISFDVNEAKRLTSGLDKNVEQAQQNYKSKCN